MGLVHHQIEKKSPLPPTFLVLSKSALQEKDSADD